MPLCQRGRWGVDETPCARNDEDKLRPRRWLHRRWLIELVDQDIIGDVCFVEVYRFAINEGGHFCWSRSHWLQRIATSDLFVGAKSPYELRAPLDCSRCADGRGVQVKKSNPILRAINFKFLKVLQGHLFDSPLVKLPIPYKLILASSNNNIISTYLHQHTMRSQLLTSISSNMVTLTNPNLTRSNDQS